MKRGLALFLAALLTALTLSACGASSGSKGGGMDAGESASSAAAAPADSNYQGNWVLDSAAEAPSPEEAEPGEGRLANAKMIYTASIEAETTDFDRCCAELEALVERMGGYLEHASADSYGDGRRSGEYTARVPAGQFEAFLGSVGDIGHVTSKSRDAENISELYYDTESRLITQRTKMERLQALLAKAEVMEDIITLENAIAETELEIEQLTGSLRHYDALVDYATVQVRLREVLRLSTVEESPPTFSSQLGSAFTGGIRSFGDFLQGLALFLAYNWLWLLLLAAIVALSVRASRRRQARRTEAFHQASGPNPGLFRRRKPEDGKKPDDKQPKD
jgi:hypothetical protein